MVVVWSRAVHDAPVKMNDQPGAVIDASAMVVVLGVFQVVAPTTIVGP